MKVSVIVPTYRRDWELRRALDSLIKQNFSDFEIIVVDDNDDAFWSEKVKAIISEVGCFADCGLQYLQNGSRLGSAQSRNEGIRIAQGEYITFLDDDDEYLPEKIQRQYEFMVEGRLDYSITDIDLYFENGRLSERRNRKYIKNMDRVSLLEYHFMYHMTGTDVIMLKRTYLEQIGGFPPIDVGDEFYLMQKAVEGGGKFGYLEVCDVRAYVHTGEGGLSSGEGKIAGEKRIYAHKKKYFQQLRPKSVRYIRMRHYAVLAFAEYRMRNYGNFFAYGIVGFFCSPIQCVKLIFDRKK